MKLSTTIVLQKRLIRLLVDIVSRGGNLLLNIGPKSDGTIPNIMVDRLLEIGKWLEINGEAIYGTITNRVFQTEDIKFTLTKDKKTLFAFVERVSSKRIGDKRCKCYW